MKSKKNHLKLGIFFNDFLDEAENQLEYSEEFLKEMEEIIKKVQDGDYSDFVKVESLEDLFECCHTCGNCISDEEEHLTCIYDNQLKN